MKIDEDRNITIEMSRDVVIENNSGINIISENGLKFVLPYEKIRNSQNNNNKLTKK